MLLLFSIVVADCLKKSCFFLCLPCVSFMNCCIPLSLLLWRTGCGVWVSERALQLVYHACLSWTDATFCKYFFPFWFWCKAVGSTVNCSFWSVSSKRCTNGISSKNATRSNCLKITCIMMNVISDRDINAFLFQWYFLNGAVCPYLDLALMD